ncbi:WD40-repeat-containing domain protein [Dichotomopilus funicola]|uniref:WD40-repeat-containing domain protein n=1 Tax=Dichotomopilus funicola TaxID=1934379 RepID=A0AAN6ZLW8_9PEZI|nr:WD40-repeat-containing domain protein [Dichotomopilus funicola]
MPIEIEKIIAPGPATRRAQSTQLSSDPKGERIAYAFGKSIFLRHLDDPSLSKQYIGHTANTTIARFSPSGFWVASGDESGQVRVWDAVEAVNTRGEYPIISGRIADIAWDGDSQRIIAVGEGRGRFGHCITADSGNTVGEIMGHSGAINSVSIRQQRPIRAATVADDGSMCFFHGTPFKFNTKQSDSHKGYVTGTAFSPDGSTLVTVGADKGIQLYDGKTGEPTRKIGEGVHTGSILAVSWAKDSARFVTASADQTVRVWDAASGELVQTWRIGEEGSVDIERQQVGVVWPHGRSDGLIVSLSLNGDLNYLKVGSDKPVKVVQGHNKNVISLGVTSEGQGKAVTTGSFDGKVYSWDLSTGTGAAVEGQAHSNKVTHFASGGGQTYSIGWDDTLRTIQESTNNFLSDPIKLSSQPQGVAVAADNTTIVALNDGIAVYANGKLLKHLPTSYTPTALAAHNTTVAVGGASNNTVEIYTLSPHSGDLSLTRTLPNTSSPVVTLAFSPGNGAHLAAGNTSGKITVYSTSGDWEVVTNRWSAHTGRVLSIAWNAAGTHAASGSLDTHVYVWSLAKPGARVQASNAHKDGVYGVAWVKTGEDGVEKVLSTGSDAAVKIWKVGGLE